MKSNSFFALLMSVVALAFVPMSTAAQSPVADRIFYPPEMSPLLTGRLPQTQWPLIPATKFVKVKNAIPNRYIVVLNDDVVASDAPLDVRREEINAIANSLAQAHGGTVGSVYETALKGFSVELPDEAAAIALSENPQVKWVEEDGTLQLDVFPMKSAPKVTAPGESIQAAPQKDPENHPIPRSAATGR